MSPRDFREMLDVHASQERALDYRAGVVASAALNAARQRSSDHMFTPTDFFPSLDQKKKAAQKALSTEEADVVVAVFRAYADGWNKQLEAAEA